MALAGALACGGAIAEPEGALPSAADETTPSMSTLRSLDRSTGGYRGWGSMANLQGPYSTPDAGSNDFLAERNHRAIQLAEVKQAREKAWVANAPLRETYQLRSIGATKAEAAVGQVRFDSRELR
jgi:hypothetical protein